MANDMTDFQAKQWGKLRRQVERLETRVTENSLYEVAQVARAVPRFADSGSLPTGALGMLACTEDTGKLYFHNGTIWKEVTLV